MEGRNDENEENDKTMKMRMKKIITCLAALAFATGCVELRELYEESGTTLYILSAWDKALGDPTMDATMLLYGADGVGKEFYQRLNGVSAQVSEGHYDLLLFNGVMESENETNLDHIYLRGTDALSTFEVCAAEVKPSLLISRAESEYIAASNMSPFALAHGEVDITEAHGLRMKYADGRRVEYGADATGEIRVEFSPRAYNYRFRVRMTGLGNPLSAEYVAGAVRGFAGSVFPAVSPDGVPRMGFPATYHLNFPTGTSRTRVSEEGEEMEIGTLESQTFVTFGPALAAAGEQLPASGVYFFEPVVRLVDGTEFRLAAPIDITAQVNEIAAVIAGHHHPDGQRIAHADNLFIIEIPDLVVLPVVKKTNPIPNNDTPVDVDDWGPDEPAVVWI